MTIELTEQETAFIRNVISQIQVKPLDPNALAIVSLIQEIDKKLGATEQPEQVQS